MTNPILSAVEGEAASAAGSLLGGWQIWAVIILLFAGVSFYAYSQHESALVVRADLKVAQAQNQVLSGDLAKQNQAVLGLQQANLALQAKSAQAQADAAKKGSLLTAAQRKLDQIIGTGLTCDSAAEQVRELFQ